MPLLQDSEAIRQGLLARNLYTPLNPYEIDNPKIVDAINSIAKIVTPTKSIDITNTVIGRVVGPNTPIAQIGIEQLAKQFGQSFVERSLINVMPSISFANLFDGDPSTKLFTKKSDYRITIDPTNNKIEDFLNRISGRVQVPQGTPILGLSPSKNQYTTSYDSSSDNSAIIRNTGKGVLNFFYDSLNKSLYKKSDLPFLSTTSSKNFEIIPAGAEWFGRLILPTNDPENFPNSDFANLDYINTITTDNQFASIDDKGLEYGSDSYMRRRGVTNLPKRINFTEANADDSKTYDFEFNENDFGFEEFNESRQIVWGGEDPYKLSGRVGMLAYTRALFTARNDTRRKDVSTNYMDQTQTKWSSKEDGSLMYNGSPLTKNIDGETKLTSDGKPIRQHNILNPYNRFEKAIRYKGNSYLYNGPVDSVIYEHVIPKMHPIKPKVDDEFGNKNMMFSIENLAFRLNNEGYIGDNFGTKVPKSEVGQHRGRVMWFPPYGITLNESAIAKYESTALIGRGEPIYSFSNSERIARLSFKLIVDYPPQIRGKSHGDVSKFFAFGGSSKTDGLGGVDINALEAKGKQIDDELAKLVPKKVQENPKIPQTKDNICSFYFPNDIPVIGSEGKSAIDGIIGLNYEMGNGTDTIDGKNDNGYNAEFEQKVLDFVNNDLNDPEAWKYIKLIFKGSATKLNQHTPNYNKLLSKRRIDSLKAYVEQVFFDVYGKYFTPDSSGIVVDVSGGEGDVNGGDKGKTVEFMNDPDVKLERKASITITYSGVVLTKDTELSADEIQRKKDKEQEKNDNDDLIKAALDYQNGGTLFRLRNIEDKQPTGFEPVTDRYLSPVFHSQTPEDFHRRLTFLQQCTRQGNATVNQSTVSNDIAVSRNSVFGRPPICVLRIGDFFHTKVVIDSVDFDYADSPWDMNPEGMGMQFMIASIDITMRVIGGQSLKAPIDIIQNGNSFNYYANSTYYPTDVYATARQMENTQVSADGIALSALSKKIDNDTYGKATDNSKTTATTK